VLPKYSSTSYSATSIDSELLVVSPSTTPPLAAGEEEKGNYFQTYSYKDSGNIGQPHNVLLSGKYVYK